MNTYACNAATNNSNPYINNENPIDIGETAADSKIKISDIKLNIIICPAVMFANKRIINAKGFVNIPKTSTGIIIGNNHFGTPGVAKICPQYALFPLNIVSKNVKVAKTPVNKISLVSVP